MAKKIPEETTDVTEPTKSESSSKPRAAKIKKYCVRAICPKCKNRTFERVEATDEPKRGDILDKKCEQEGCEGTLQVISIYSKE